MTKSMKRLLTPRPLWRMAGCRLGCASPSSHCSVNSIVSNPPRLLGLRAQRGLHLPFRLGLGLGEAAVLIISDLPPQRPLQKRLKDE